MGNLLLTDPQFRDPDGPDDNFQTYVDNDTRLLQTSPCIDAGANLIVRPAPLTPSGVATDVVDLDSDLDILERTPFDLDGQSRFMDGAAVETGVGDPPNYPAPFIVDMGAFEFPDFDYNDDDCVDLRDFAVFQNNFTGPSPGNFHAFQLFLEVFLGPCGSEGLQMLQGGGPEAGEFASMSMLTDGVEDMELALQLEPTEEELFQSIKSDYLDLLAIEWNGGLSEPMIAFIVLSPGSVDRLPDDRRKELAAELGSRLEQCKDDESCKSFPSPVTRSLIPTLMAQLTNTGACDSAGFRTWLHDARFVMVPEDCDDNGVSDWDELNPHTDDNGNWVLDRCAEDSAAGLRLWSIEEIAYVVLGAAYQHLTPCPCDLVGEKGLQTVVEAILGELSKSDAEVPILTDDMIDAVIDSVDGFAATECMP